MRIAVLAAKFPPQDIGGAEISVYNFAKLASRRHEVHVITREQKALKDKSRRDGFTIHTVRCIGRTQVLRYWSTARALAKRAREIKPDIIYSEALYSAGMAGAKAGKRLGIPVVIRLAGEIYWTGGFIQRRLVRRIVKESGLVIALTEHMKREVLKYCPDARVEVVGEGVDYEFFRKSEKAKLPKNSILYIGRFVKMKGVEYLVRAFKIVKEKVPDARLFLGGYGPEEKNLKRLAKDLRVRDISFLGPLGRSEMAGYLKACSVFALPSTSEGFPLTIVEAMTSGCPIVSTNVRGLPEIMKDGRNGLLVKPRDEKGLAEKIGYLLKNPRTRERFSRNNIKDARKYSWERVVSSILEKIEAMA